MLSLEETKAEYMHNVKKFMLPEVRDISQRFNEVLHDDAMPKDGKLAQTQALIEQSEDQLQQHLTTLNKMQIYFNIATGHMNAYSFSGASQYDLLAKAILKYRKALEIYESEKDSISEGDQKITNHIAMKCYVNLGNIMKTVGRYIYAIDSYNNALLIDDGFAMASINLSSTLLACSWLQIKPNEQQYYHHAAYYYYQQTKSYKVNLEETDYLDDLEKKMDIFHSEYIEMFLTKELKLPDFDVNNQDEIDYREHLQICNLFLDACGEILREPCFAVDSVVLPESEFADEKKEFCGLFNQIKAEYIHGRYLWYATTVKNLETPVFVERENDFIPINDNSVFNVKDTLLRAAFRTLYSIFDKIGYFLNYYFDVGLKENNISFKNIWRNKVGKVNVPHPIKLPTQNAGLCALYWLQKDLYDKEEMNPTSPFSINMAEMRNDMEHNALISVNTLSKANPSAKMTKYVTDMQIEHNVYKIMKLLREAIIYLTIAVNEDIKSKSGDSSVIEF